MGHQPCGFAAGGAFRLLRNIFYGKLGTDMEILVPLLSISAAIASAVGIARLIVGGAAQLGLCSYYNRLIKGETPQVSELFSRFSFFGKALLLNLYTALLTFLWSLLLVIPGIIATYRYSLAFYVLCDNPEMSVTAWDRRSVAQSVCKRGDERVLS